ncbi:hypothetical protein KFL_000450310 [Klebsormidium nitens]|uniref:Coiled-coil domain-containing protein 130 n=1 Tax=Klebsormidium nitens TaxID=105231 RepID=A0A1Y1HN53_KLENI|nr:hypothetical protein KFL_000450310 [Klebsormidium nitens]|eukprot:GAQ80075.1 hypothetical protein KFL_000450310 [Klebsormidium nitens]
MSTLAAARADNFYFPPEWTPEQGGLNKFQGQHPLRERAKKLKSEGILVVRFEMPFKVWCEGCGHLIATGVRFNAEKKQIGNYFSTKIWSFVMKSPCCQTEIEIQTDPKSTQYIVVRGAKQKVETYDAADAGTAELNIQEDREKLADPFFKLEHAGDDVRRARTAVPLLTQLKNDSDAKHADPFARNKALRKQLREQKKRVAEETVEARKKGLGLRLLPAAKEDAEAAARVRYGVSNKSGFDENRRKRRAAIRASSIFQASSSGKEGVSGKARVELPDEKRRKADLLAKEKSIDAFGVSRLLSGNVKRTHQGDASRPSKKQASMTSLRAVS